MKLPDWLKERTIEGMKVNEIAWTVPWAMAVGVDEHLYLNGKYGIIDYPSGTTNMRIKRTHQGFEVIVQKDTTIKSEPSNWPGTNCPIVSVSDGELR